MKTRHCCCLVLGLLFLAGCKETEILGGMTGGVLGAAGVPGSQYAESAVKSGTALAHATEDFTPQQEYYIGRAVAANLFLKYPPLEDTAANEYVNLLGQSLALFSDLPQTYGGYHFQIVNSMEINAFAAPGGFVLVTKGLIKCCPDEDALAAVLAHEISHVQNRDAVRSIKKSRVTQALGVMGGEAAKNLAPAQVSQLTGIFSDSIGDIVTTMVSNGYSRSYEFQADKNAVNILTRAGYSPSGLTRMLEVMQTKLTPGGSGFAKTHPSPQDRIRELGANSGQVVVPAVQQSRFKLALGNL
jgi:predicted Zn-dependent protease